MAVDKPIIEIPIDDSAFQRFSEAFAHFRKQTKELPEDWEKLNKQWQKSGTSQKSFMNLVINSSGHLDKMAKTMDDIADAQVRIAKGAKGANASFSGMFTSLSKSQTVLSRIGGSLKGLIGLGLGGVAGSVLGGLGAFDLGGFAMGQGRSARGIGMSPGAMQAFTTSMQPFLASPDAVLQGAAGAKYDLTKSWALASLGISRAQIQGNNPAQLAVLEAQRIRSGAQKMGLQNYWTYLNASGVTGALGFNQSDVFNLANANGAQLAGSEKSALTPLPGFSPKSENAWDNFVVAIDQAGDKIKDVFVTGFTPLVPKLTELVAQFSDFVVAFVSNPHFADDVKNFAVGATLVAQEVMAVAEKLKWVLPTPDQAQSQANQLNSMSPFPRRILDIYHNPGNIMDTMPDGSQQLHTFKNQAGGYRALASLLQRKYNNDTISQLVNTYAPASAGNDVNSYIKNLSAWSGIDSNKPLDLNDPQTLDAIVAGIVRQEGIAGKISAQKVAAYLGQTNSPKPHLPASVENIVDALRNLQNTNIPRPVAPQKVSIMLYNKTGSSVSISTNAAAGS